MKKVFYLLASVILFSFTTTTMAQSSAQLNNETKFIVAKAKGSVNIRKMPNAKAAKAGSLAVDQTLPVVGEKQGWYQVLMPDKKTGWISQTACKEMTATLDEDKVCNHVYGVSETYEDCVEWEVGKIAGTDMYVALTSASNMDEPLGCPWNSCLWLGKKIGNVLVFDQYVFFSPQYSSDDANLFNLMTSDYIINEISYTLYFGDNYSMPDNQGGNRLRPSSLPQKTIQQLFNGKQKKDRILILGPALFTKKYADVQFG